MNDKAEELVFSNRDEYRNWLTINHNQKNGIWIIFEKGNKNFTANNALEEAICFGWIDGLVKTINEKSYKKYFSRRKNINNWSEKNIRIYKNLLNKGMMTKAGTEVYKPIQLNTRLELSINDKIELLRMALSDVKEVLELFNENTSSRQKQLAGFFCEAKTEETRKKRKTKIIEALKTNYKGMLY